MTIQDDPSETKPHQKAIIGPPHGSFWLYDSKQGYDLTHPNLPSEAHPHPSSIPNSITLQTTDDIPIKIDPAKSALVIIDMQNMFLSPCLGRDPGSKGLKAQQQLLEHAIPSARKAGIRVIWLNWGLTKEDLKTMPPAVERAFGMQVVGTSDYDSHVQVLENGAPMSDEQTSQWRKKLSAEPLGKSERVYVGLGNELGSVKLDDGNEVDAGTLLMRDQWNTKLTPALDEQYQVGLKSSPPDVWIHKNRMSGLWGAGTPCTDFLDKHDIKTLFFAGVNTDQCVWGSLQDAFQKGYDCILLSDGAATSSPGYAQDMCEFNAKGFGFVMGCEGFARGVEGRLGGGERGR